MLNPNFLNPRFANQSDFRQPVSQGTNNRRPVVTQNPVNPSTGSSNFAPSGGFFSASVPDDVGAELDRFRQARNRFGVGVRTP